MDFNWCYTLVFGIMWFIMLWLILKTFPMREVFPITIMYCFVSVILYFFIWFLINAYLDKRSSASYKEKQETEENLERFSRYQFLRNKYKYKKLTIDGIVSDTEIKRDDKLLLLEFLHNSTPEEARRLLSKPS